MGGLFRSWLLDCSGEDGRRAPKPVSAPLPAGRGRLPVVLALSLLPIRVVHEINADWPLCAWLLALDVVALSLYAIFLAGGWPWVRHFLFPVSFILVAVIWPYRIEHGLTQGLMRTVAALDVELLDWINVPAFQHGNLIEINTGMVSIDAACSGIRSLQSTVMAALFLGELYLLTRPRRALLIVGGMVAAFCFNVLRTFILTWQAANLRACGIGKMARPGGGDDFCRLLLLSLGDGGVAADEQGAGTIRPSPPRRPRSMPRAPCREAI